MVHFLLLLEITPEILLLQILYTQVLKWFLVLQMTQILGWSPQRFANSIYSILPLLKIYCSRRDRLHRVQQSFVIENVYMAIERRVIFFSNAEGLRKKFTIDQQLPCFHILLWGIQLVNTTSTVYPKAVRILIKYHSWCISHCFHHEIIILNYLLCDRWNDGQSIKSE